MCAGCALLKVSKLSKNYPKLFTALCGTIQVFFIMYKYSKLQSTFILARKPLNPTHSIQCFASHVMVILNIGELWLE